MIVYYLNLYFFLINQNYVSVKFFTPMTQEYEKIKYMCVQIISIKFLHLEEGKIYT